MDFAPILRQIDAEIETLNRIRHIVAGLGRPLRPALKQALREVAQPAPAQELVPEPLPQVRVLPPVRRREYSPRPRSAARPTGALASVVSAQPVFVPRAIPPATVVATPAPAAMGLDQVEAAIRQNLLGRFA